MNIKTLLIFACAGTGMAILTGCASAPVAPIPAQLLWQDEAFNYHLAPAPISKQQLFALDANLLATLKGSRLERASAQQRVNRLLTLIYGPGYRLNGIAGNAFPYQMGSSSIAAETWRTKRGDCLSLLVLAYSIAKAMDLPAIMQDVNVQPVVDRYGGVDYVAGHVNLLIKSGGRLQLFEGFGIGDVVIDFEPQIGSQRVGSALSEDAVLARFYNNLAAEYLVDGKLDLAYAYFKAAILADASFSSSYANLALVYKRRGLLDESERLLRHAIALNDRDDVALGTLQRLLQVQGRSSEAAHYARVLEARRERNPYYWFGLGLAHFQQANYRAAIVAFEQAEALSTGFEEVHRYLAIAYMRTDNAAAAQRHVTVLTRLAAAATAAQARDQAMVARKIAKPILVN